MARRGRKAKTKEQKLKDAEARNAPADYILDRRRLFSFVQPPANKRHRSIGRVDIRWVVRNHQPCIEWAVPPSGNLGR